VIQCVEARPEGRPCPPVREGDGASSEAVDQIVKRLVDKQREILRKSKQRHFINPEKTAHADSRTIGGEHLILQTPAQLGPAHSGVIPGFSGYRRKPKILADSAGEPAMARYALARLRGIELVVSMDASIGTENNLTALRQVAR